MPPRINHTTCRHCGVAIVGVAPYRRDKWRDGNGQYLCPALLPAVEYHAPVVERLTIRKDEGMSQHDFTPSEANPNLCHVCRFPREHWMAQHGTSQPPAPARLYFLVAVDVDRAAILSDNPPEDVGECVAGELRSHLEEKGVRGACGIVRASVLAIAQPSIISAMADNPTDFNPIYRETLTNDKDITASLTQDVQCAKGRHVMKSAKEARCTHCGAQL